MTAGALSPADLAACSRLLDDALDLPAPERAAWLARLAPEHAHLRDALAEMLDAEAPALTLPSLGGTEAGAAASFAGRIGEVIGPWRLLRELGRGGMGSVWLAERADGDYERRVALKLPRLAWTEGLAARMARERRIGALLEHPSIARLYDAGVDAQGRPYLAIEYIDGEALDVHARALDVRATVALMAKVARAVAYAHGRLVIHRDLKPANVMVDGRGEPHLLDFGIAKLAVDQAAAAAGGQGVAATALTQEHGSAYTPQYAAPEQIAGGPIGVQADVYALGVMLYELLAGQLPYRPTRPGLGALEQAILQGDAPPPSTRVVTRGGEVGGDASADKARARQIAGELDAIVGKALKRELTERYDSAQALADDLERYLRDEPVRARPDSAVYRLRKAVRRNWLAVSAGSAVLVAVLGGSVFAAYHAHRAAQAAEQAQRAVERERVVKDFVAEVFKPRPRQAGGGTDSLVEQGAQLIATRFSGQPELQSELYGVVGGIFAEMGANKLAVEYGTKRLALMEGPLQVPKAEQVRVLIGIAESLLEDGRGPLALERAKQAEVLSRGSDDHPSSLVMLSRAQSAADTQAMQATLRRIETLAAERPLPPAVMAWLQWLRGEWESHNARFDVALPELRRAAATMTSIGRLPEARGMSLEIARQLMMTNRWSDAIAEAGPVLERMEKEGGTSAIRAAQVRAQMWSMAAGNSVSKHEALQVLERARSSLLEQGMSIPESLLDEFDYLLAYIRYGSGDLAGAHALIGNRVESMWQRQEGNLIAQFRLAAYVGYLEMHRGATDVARKWLLRMHETRRKLGRDKHPWAAYDHVALSENERMAGNFAAALSRLDAAPSFPPLEGDERGHAFAHAVAFERVEVMLDMNRPEEAMRLFERIPAFKGYVSPDPEELRGRILCASGQFKQGLPSLERKIIEMEQRAAGDKPGDIARLRALAGRCALAQGLRSQAVAHAVAARESFVEHPDVHPWFKKPLEQLEKELGIKPPKAAATNARRAASGAAPPKAPPLNTSPGAAAPRA